MKTRFHAKLLADNQLKISLQNLGNLHAELRNMKLMLPNGKFLTSKDKKRYPSGLISFGLYAPFGKTTDINIPLSNTTKNLTQIKLLGRISWGGGLTKPLTQIINVTP